ncbi:hypothetical protein Avbf_02880, partial [Armadillidium vulgare]
MDPSRLCLSQLEKHRLHFRAPSVTFIGGNVVGRKEQTEKSLKFFLEGKEQIVQTH